MVIRIIIIKVILMVILMVILKVFLCSFLWYSDICAKRHLRERHLREVRGKGTKLGEGEKHYAR